MKRCLIVLVLLMLPAGALFAQERGQYVPGFGGLNAGVQAPAGWTYANYFIRYSTDRFNDRTGSQVPLDFSLDLLVDFNLVAYTTKTKLLGATYGLTVGVPLTNTSVGLARLDKKAGAFGLADIYVEPINLGWTRPGWNIKAAYGFVAPSGKFDESGGDTTTTDYWGHELTFAATRSFGAGSLWQASLNSNWEFHQSKRHEDVKVGNNVTVEYGVGRTIVRNGGKQLLQLGAVGYGEFQLTDDTGADVTLTNLGSKDRVFGLGGEFGVIWPASKWNVLVPVIPEFGARSRTQGLTLTAALGKSF
jgi:hypothetical protein